MPVTIRGSQTERQITSVCGDGLLLLSYLVPDAGAGVDVNGQIPHLRYEVSASGWDQVSGDGSAIGEKILLEFDVGAHILPFPGHVTLVGGVGDWRFVARASKFAVHASQPRTRWLRTFVDGASGAAAAFSPPPWHHWLASSEPVPIVDDQSNTIEVTQQPLPLASGATFTSRYPVYLLTGVDF